MCDDEITIRPLTERERRLAQWMIEHGTAEAKQFIGQLERASATTWTCPCGCASFNLSVDGCTTPTGRLQIIADFVYGDGGKYGAFLFAQSGILSGLEVCGYADDAPKALPEPEVLRSIS